MPSAIIEGTYRQNNMTLNTSRRHVIATVGPDKYLVSLSVTTSAQEAVAAADATDAIVNGFRVSAPGAPATGHLRAAHRNRRCRASASEGSAGPNPARRDRDRTS